MSRTSMSVSAALAALTLSTLLSSTAMAAHFGGGIGFRSSAASFRRSVATFHQPIATMRKVERIGWHRPVGAGNGNERIPAAIDSYHGPRSFPYRPIVGSSTSTKTGPNQNVARLIVNKLVDNPGGGAATGNSSGGITGTGIGVLTPAQLATLEALTGPVSLLPPGVQLP